MTQYINKDALIAEIKKHQAIWDGMDDDYCKGQRLAYSDMISFLDTLEVKEANSTDAFIDKACKWLKENKDHPLIGCEDICLSGYLTDEFIEDFKNYMKGE